MTPKRLERFKESLAQGNILRAVWKGTSNIGYLSYQLAGVERIRAKEVEELKRLRLIEIYPRDEYKRDFGFYPSWIHYRAKDFRTPTSSKIP